MYTAPAARQLGQLHVDPTQFPDTYPAGRVCAVPKCSTVISVYNPGNCCYCCGGTGRAQLDTKPAAEALVELMQTP